MTTEKSFDLKKLISFVIPAVTVILALMLVFKVVTKPPTEQEIVEGDWKSEELTMIRFDTPDALDSNEKETIDLSTLYAMVDIISDGNNERLTYGIEGTLHADTISTARAFYDGLEAILLKRSVDLNKLQLDNINVSENEMSATYSFYIGEKRVLGFGYLLRDRNKAESLWLVPVSSGFSSEYIKKFEKRIRRSEHVNS